MVDVTGEPNSPRVVVVVGAGAGASDAIRFPTGKELATEIADLLRSAAAVDRQRNPLWDHVQRHEGSDFARIFRRKAPEVAAAISYFRSVDEYLDSRGDDPDIVKIGKIGIAAIIHGREASSPLYKLAGEVADARKSGLNTLSATWIAGLFRFLTSGVRRSNVDTIFKDIAFINFNYDRVLEHCLLQLLREAYTLQPRQAAQALLNLRIIHPYGKLGRLPWESGDGPPIGFGDEGAMVCEMAARLSTLTEQLRDEKESEEILNLLRGAEKVVFLGFGFHTQNMKLLHIGGDTGMKDIFATTFQVSPSDDGVFRQRLSGAFGINPSMFHMIPSTCENAMGAYGLQIWG